ncbi:FAD-dependent monooxygenase [Streptomyces mirabilis]|uniref:FAD-dependent monooxygenase n=1 Tax=Streptomyces sp. AK02-04a TaxID=3028649 RepID=UPI0029B68D15|nr:FAD-dependent monooxygenase [Streptomyces sp. AK02-04a]MDX3755244.1 FAD-dependent monooxygenase [Streptomyces sp. AK02-04a]
MRAGYEHRHPDALNPGRQLAVVCQGAAPEELLETYEAERVPVCPNVLRFTDRAFTIATSRNEAETPAYLRPRRKHRRLGHAERHRHAHPDGIVAELKHLGHEPQHSWSRRRTPPLPGHPRLEPALTPEHPRMPRAVVPHTHAPPTARSRRTLPGAPFMNHFPGRVNLNGTAPVMLFVRPSRAMTNRRIS